MDHGECKFYESKSAGFFSDSYDFCNLIDEGIEDKEVDNYCRENHSECPYYKYYLKKKRELLIEEMVREELG